MSAVLALVPLMTLGFQRLTLVFFPGFDTGPPLDATHGTSASFLAKHLDAAEAASIGEES